MRRVLALAALVACGGVGSTPLDGDGGGDGGSDAAPSSDGSSNDAPGADVHPGVDAAAFDPKSLSGLVLWLRGDLGVTSGNTGLVSAWKDQSGNANDATETRDGLQPTLVASGIHGLPSVHFASTASSQAFSGFQGNDLLIADSATMEWGTGDFLVEVVARYTNDPTSQTHDAFAALYIAIYGPPSTATSGLGLYGNVWNEPNDLASSSAIEAYVWGQPPATSSGSGYNSGAPHVFAIQRVGTTLSVRVDGAQAGSQAIGSVDLGKPGGRLGGCENAQAQRLEGDIAEVLAVKGTIASGDLASLEAYLKTRYATP